MERASRWNQFMGVLIYAKIAKKHLLLIDRIQLKLEHASTF